MKIIAAVLLTLAIGRVLEWARRGGYQPRGPALDTSNPPKGGSGVRKAA